LRGRIPLLRALRGWGWGFGAFVGGGGWVGEERKRPALRGWRRGLGVGLLRPLLGLGSFEGRVSIYEVVVFFQSFLAEGFGWQKQKVINGSWKMSSLGNGD